MNNFFIFPLILLAFGKIITDNSISPNYQRSPEILFCNANREIRIVALNESLLTSKPNVFRRRDRKYLDRMDQKLRTRRNGANGGCNNDIDYDFADNYLIWSNLSSIIVAPLDRRTKNSLNIQSKKLLVKTNEVQRVSLDWIHDLLYYLENGEIKVMDVKTLKVRTISDERQKEYYSAIDIVVNPIDNFIAWIRLDRRTSDYKLMKADQTGANQKVLLDLGYYGYETRGQSPCCLTVDYESRRIYLLNNKDQTLESILFDGSKKSAHFRSALFAQTNSIDIYGDHVFWSNRAQNAIVTANKYGKSSSIKTILKSEQNIDSIKIVHHSKQPLVENRCEMSECPHLCVPSTNHQYFCLCDDDNRRQNDCSETHFIVSNITINNRQKNAEELAADTKVNEISVTESYSKDYPLYVFRCLTNYDHQSNETVKTDWYTSDNQKLSVKYKKSPIARNITRIGADVELRISYPNVKLLTDFKCRATKGNQSFETLYKVIVRQMPFNPKILSHSLSFAGVGKIYLTLQIENQKVDPPIDKYRIAYRGIFNFYQQEYWLDINALSANESDRNTIYIVKLDVDYNTQDLLAFKVYAHNDVGWSTRAFN